MGTRAPKVTCTLADPPAAAAGEPPRQGARNVLREPDYAYGLRDRCRTWAPPPQGNRPERHPAVRSCRENRRGGRRAVWIGLDVHKEDAFVCELGDEGEVLREFRLPSNREAVREYASRLGPPDRVALESTTHALAFVDLFREHVGKVVLADARRTKAALRMHRKTDRKDARALAELLRAGLVPEVWVPDPKTRWWRRRVAHREALVRHRIRVKNRVHGLFHRNMIPVPAELDLFGPDGEEWIRPARERRLPMPDDDREQLEMELELLEVLDRQVAVADRRLAAAGTGHPDVKLLLTIPGVGPAVASGLVAALGPAERFPSPKHLVSYLGLAPSVAQSGRTVRLGRITKAGRKHARWLLLEAARRAVRLPGPLAAFYERIEDRRLRNVARVAVARKLATLTWHVLTARTPCRWTGPLLSREKLRSLERRAGEVARSRNSPRPEGELPYHQQRRAERQSAQEAQDDYVALTSNWSQRPAPLNFSRAPKAASSRPSGGPRTPSHDAPTLQCRGR